MGRRRHPLEVAFELGLGALPPGPLRRDDRREMARTLRDQIAAAPTAAGRVRVAWRAIRRLPGVLIAEWLDWLGITGPYRGPSTGREGDGMLSNLLRNLGFAGRALRKAPTFTAASILLVALGVGTVTTAFTVVDHVLLRALPYPAQERLAYLTNGSHNGPTLDRLDGVAGFDLWTAATGHSVNLTRPDGDPLRLRRIETTPAFFTMFGARPHLGRLLVDADRDDLGIAVLSWPFWRDAFGGDPEIVGTTMVIDGEPIEIVGVLAEDFVQPSVLGDGAHFYRPIDWSNPGLQEPGYHAHSVLARLAPGVSLEVANEQIDRVEASVAEAFPEYYDDGPQDWPLVGLHEVMVQDVRSGLLLLLGAVGLLLLVACANVAHLFLARGLSRGGEMSIRRAMRARTWSRVGQLSAESLLVGLLGGLGGAALAQGALVFFRRWTVELPRGLDVAVDLRVLAVCIGVATATAFVCGLLPALRAVGRDVQEGLRGARGMTGSRRLGALRSGLIVFEVAISLVLVASAGLLMRSFLSVTAIDPGIEAEDVWVVPLNPTNVSSPEDYRNRMEPIRQAFLSIPGVTEASYGIEGPFEWVGGDRCCWSNRAPPPDEPEATPIRVFLHPVSEGFFATYGTELLAGTPWTRATATASPTPVVISEAMAIRFFGSAEAAVDREIPELRGGVVVAGVAEATKHYGLDQEHDYGVYIPIETLPFEIDRATFGLRFSDVPADLAGAIRRAVWSEEPNLPVTEVASLEAWIDDSSATRRFGSLLLGAFGIVALLLAAAGLYGTLLYAVGQRRQELGIRLALGAGRGRIQNDVIRRGVVHALLGVGAGVLLTLWAGRLLEAWLFGVTGTDALTLAGAAAVLFATAVAASWLPAYRAGRTDPLETLKAE